ncbi:MAG: hypothetical protein SGPRY_008974, partial [Prymnesium sp.]
PTATDEPAAPPSVASEASEDASTRKITNPKLSAQPSLSRRKSAAVRPPPLTPGALPEMALFSCP